MLRSGSLLAGARPPRAPPPGGTVRAPRRRAAAHARRRGLHVAAALVARWTLDARAGCRAEAAALCREWLAEVAAQADGGLATAGRLLQHQIGGPESRLELELTFESLAQLEAFFGALPSEAHAAWAARVSGVVVDASSHWTVLRLVPLGGGAAEGGAGADAAASFGSPAPLQQAQVAPLRRTPGGLFLPPEPAGARAAAAAPAPLPLPPAQPPKPPVLDWKGARDTASGRERARARERERSSNSVCAALNHTRAPRARRPPGDPMVINPGDKMPFF